MPLFLVPGVIWGSEWVVTRGLDAPALGGLALRYGLAAVLLGGVAGLRRTPLPERRSLAVSAICGIGFLVVPAVLTAWASQRVSPGLLVVMLSLAPLLAALIEGRASGGLLAPLVGGVGGTAVLASQGLSFSAAQWMGGLAALLAAVSIAGSVVVTKRRLECVAPLWMAVVQLAAGTIVAGVLSGVLEGRAALDWSWRSFAVEAILAVAGSVLSLPIYYWLLRRLESFQLTASQWVVTLAALGGSWVLAGMAPGWRVLAGAGVLMASGTLLLLSRPGDDAFVTLQSTFPPSAR
jgi:drug/metabolite transporter (DMT)-like permease